MRSAEEWLSEMSDARLAFMDPNQMEASDEAYIRRIQADALGAAKAAVTESLGMAGADPVAAIERLMGEG